MDRNANPIQFKIIIGEDDEQSCQFPPDPDPIFYLVLIRTAMQRYNDTPSLLKV